MSREKRKDSQGWGAHGLEERAVKWPGSKRQKWKRLVLSASGAFPRVIQGPGRPDHDLKRLIGVG
jgi:hypothetical protein